jgi:uncharacterized protein YegL
MNLDYTHITLVIDRSGSMHSVKTDAEGGVNAFLTEQALQPGRCTYSIFEFNHTVVPRTEFAPIDNHTRYFLNPQGNTALHDAIAHATIETGKTLKSMPEATRPGRVMLVIMTDGWENASREYRDPASVKALLKRQQETYSWEVVFLSANLDVKEAQARSFDFGIQHTTAIPVLNGPNVRAAYAGLSASATQFRNTGAAVYDTVIDEPVKDPTQISA